MKASVMDYAPTCTDEKSFAQQTAAHEKRISKSELETAVGLQILNAVKEQLGESRFDLWFNQHTTCRHCGTKVLFLVRNTLTISGIQTHCKDAVESAVAQVVGKGSEIVFQVERRKNNKKQTVEKEKLSTAHKTVHQTGGETNSNVGLNHLNKTNQRAAAENRERNRFHSLDTFIADQSNDLALRGVELALRHPSQINPIYIYGDTGVGKTHLLEGIWKKERAKGGKAMPLYLTAEQFLSAFMHAIRPGGNNNDKDFRCRFKNISMLLIDDVHFFSGKVATQNEFLHVMDDCIQHGVQIVLSGNRKPDDLDLHNNVAARIASGIACGIGLPEPELALQLCRNTAIERRMDLSDEVCRMIADRFGASARLIQGALNRLYAATLCKQTLCTQPEQEQEEQQHESVRQKQISGSTGGSASSTFASATLTLSFAEELLSDLPSMKRTAMVTLKDVEKAVCEAFNIHREVLQSKSRTKNVTRPRMIAMYLARKFTQSALSEIGAFFGKMSHSSVISSQQRVERWIETNDKIVPVLRGIEKRLT